MQAAARRGTRHVVKDPADVGSRPAAVGLQKPGVSVLSAVMARTLSSGPARGLRALEDALADAPALDLGGRCSDSQQGACRRCGGVDRRVEDFEPDAADPAVRHLRSQLGCGGTAARCQGACGVGLELHLKRLRGALRRFPRHADGVFLTRRRHPSCSIVEDGLLIGCGFSLWQTWLEVKKTVRRERKRWEGADRRLRGDRSTTVGMIVRRARAGRGWCQRVGGSPARWLRVLATDRRRERR